MFLPHLSNLAVGNEFTELLLAHAQDIVGIIAILFFLVHVFDSVIRLQSPTGCESHMPGKNGVHIMYYCSTESKECNKESLKDSVLTWMDRSVVLHLLHIQLKHL